MNSHTPDFRELLKRKFIEKNKNNSKFSLRAFANFLDIEPSALSKIINKKRQLSEIQFDKIVNKLKLQKDEIEIYKNGLYRKKNSVNKFLEAHTPNYNQISYEIFDVISDWYNFAILELTKTNNFKPDIAYVSRRLGISIDETNLAIERLLKFNLLKISEDGIWYDNSGALTTTNDEKTKLAYRKLQKKQLEQAQNAMNETPIEKRDQSSITMAIDERLIPEAKVLIKNFRRDLCKLLKNSDYKGEVYTFTTSLFPVSHNIEDENL